MDINKIKIIPEPSGQVKIEMDADLAERFKLFCLVDYYIGKPASGWELTKIQSLPSGQVTIHVKVIPLTKG